MFTSGIRKSMGFRVGLHPMVKFWPQLCHYYFLVILGKWEKHLKMPTLVNEGVRFNLCQLLKIKFCDPKYLLQGALRYSVPVWTGDAFFRSRRPDMALSFFLPFFLSFFANTAPGHGIKDMTVIRYLQKLR